MICYTLTNFLDMDMRSKVLSLCVNPDKITTFAGPRFYVSFFATVNIETLAELAFVSRGINRRFTFSRSVFCICTVVARNYYYYYYY